jgi:hypothetical protein
MIHMTADFSLEIQILDASRRRESPLHDACVDFVVSHAVVRAGNTHTKFKLAKDFAENRAHPHYFLQHFFQLNLSANHLSFIDNF